ncbi:TetR/AcrR family transcriptional regulator [Caballeronia sordidicola]|uniref:Transcriptional regulator, TetR family n=1 Tax=Caballeronia sordidicola TaxID=196367 RepID=A0A242M7C7_CABSO|nr:TetR/AcrR family transcriptional regulator [Caballeronia sordidicola]OTP67167.1 Transcriptional regulator, TetR family [Caballeronia sordidicola]
MQTPKKVTRDSEASRARILDAAKIRFSQNSYDGVGVREIAADANLDPAMVLRYFGSKENLFREIASQAFEVEALLADGIEALPERAASLLMGEVDDDAWRSGYDPLRLLLASIGSVTAGPILAEYLHRDFIAPLVKAIGGREARERGALVAAQIVGFALIRVAGDSSEGALPRRKSLKQLLVKVLEDLSRAR